MWRQLMLAALLCVAACESQNGEPTPQAGSEERERRDSILGQSQLPGAGVVNRANAVRDSSRSRAAELDSILNR